MYQEVRRAEADEVTGKVIEHATLSSGLDYLTFLAPFHPLLVLAMHQYLCRVLRASPFMFGSPRKLSVGGTWGLAPYSPPRTLRFPFSSQVPAQCRRTHIPRSVQPFLQGSQLSPTRHTTAIN